VIFLSLDVETSGPSPGQNSLVSIGAAPVVRRGGQWAVNLARTFYVELKPQPGAAEVAEATSIHGLTAEYLLEHGDEPETAMQSFVDFYDGLRARYSRVRSAAWPASFDGPFVGWMCHRYLGLNPLGHSTFDIASYAMGALDCTDRRRLQHVMKVAGYVKPANPDEHHALSDAIAQGETLAWLLNHVEKRRSTD